MVAHAARWLCILSLFLVFQAFVIYFATEYRLVDQGTSWLGSSMTAFKVPVYRYISPADHDLMIHIESLLPRPLPLISAVVPCYNYGNYVIEAVTSLAQQTYPELEIIVVDDGSTDNVTLDALKRLENMERVRVTRKANGGLASARNHGTKEAKGEYIFYLDNDDKAEPLAIHLLLLKLFHAGPNVSYAYPEQWYEGDANLVWRPQNFNYYDLLFTNHPTVCALVKKRAWAVIGGYDEMMRKGMEDWEFWLTLAKNFHFGVRVSVPLFRYNRHGVTMVTDTAKHAVTIREILIKSTRVSESYTVNYMSLTKKTWRPLISVIIPFHNPYLDWMEETIDSLKAQSIDDFEVIFVDDSSDQNTTEISSLVMTSGLANKYIRLEKRSRVSAARNWGALEARGDYLFFLDADDTIHPLTLEKLSIAALNLDDRTAKHVAYIYSGVVHYGTLNATAYDAWNKHRLLRENFLVVTCLIKKDDFLQMGGFDVHYDLWEDYDMWLRFLAYGKEGRLVREPLFLYRRHNRGRTKVNAEVKNATEMMASLKERNPQAYGLAPKAHLVQYRPLVEDYHNDIDDVVEKYARKYRTNLQATVKYQEYRRPNTMNPFQKRFWGNGFESEDHLPAATETSSGPDVRVLYLMPFFNLGGAELVDLEIIRALWNSKKFWITIVTELKTDKDVLRAEFEAISHEVFNLPALVPEDHRAADQAIATVEYLVLSRRIDLVFNRNTFVGYKLAHVYKRILGYNQTKFADLIHLYEPKYGAWERESTPYHSLFDKRFLISRDLRDHIHKFYQLPKDDFTIVYCGIDLDRWNYDTVKGKVLRSRLNITDSFPIVGYNARLTAQKEPLVWVEAARSILKLRPRTRFVMIGEGDLMEDIKAAVFGSGPDDLSKKFHLVGRVNQTDLPDYIKDFDLLLSTSSFEGVPLAMMEAMALGVPVVSPAIGGIPELVDETTGTLLAPGSGARAYAGAVVDLLSEGPANRLARKKACIERVKKKFNLQEMQDTYIDELWRLARKTDHNSMYRDALLRLMDYPLFDLPPRYWKEKESSGGGNDKNAAAPGHDHEHGAEQEQGVAGKQITYTAVEKVITWSGGIRLHSYALEFSKTSSGSYMFRCFFLWVSPAEPPVDSWVIFLHVREQGPKGRVLINADAIPNIKGAAAPTNTWMKDEIIEDEHYQQVSVREYAASQNMDLYLVLGYYVVKDGKMTLIPLADGSTEHAIRKFRWKDISTDV